MVNCLFLRARGGNRPPRKKEIANPRECARGGGMVTGRIEPCIINNKYIIFDVFCVFVEK